MHTLWATLGIAVLGIGLADVCRRLRRSERSSTRRSISSARESVLKFEIRPKADDDDTRSLDVPAGMDNVLEVRAHAQARSDVIAIKEF
jgi:hypothetical protein